MGSIRRKNGKETKEYKAWKMMKARCYAPSIKHGNYKNNNIQVCERWLNSFENFLEDMGECPENFSLDRIDNSKNYSPENCRWANKKTQSNNRGKFNILYAYIDGEVKTLKEWAEFLGIKYSTLYMRIKRNGLTFEKAIQHDPFNKLIEYKGEKRTLKEWCSKLNLPFQTIIDRKYQGWSVEDMFEKPIKTKI